MQAPGYHELVARIRREGAYSSREKAEQVVRDVLAGLGRQLTGPERVELAARLPTEAAQIMVAQIPAWRPLSGWGS